MHRIFIIIISTLIAGSAYAEITNWWGTVSYRLRHEIAKPYTDYTQAGDAGTLKWTDENFRTRVGYQFGFAVDLTDNLAAALTFRSGLGSVMLQDITSATGLTPGLQEAYIDWETPYARFHLGKIPQAGNPMWDLYAGVNETGWRINNPTDGIFNDRMAALNGGRIMVPLGTPDMPITLRGTYHSDLVSGYTRDYNDDALEDERNPDWFVILFGLNAQYNGYELDGDFGLPYRLGETRVQGTKDSIYVEEQIWGAEASKVIPNIKFPVINIPKWNIPKWKFLGGFSIGGFALGGLSLQNNKLAVGYGYNSRDSVFTADFLTVGAATEYRGYRLSGKFEKGVHESEQRTYAGSKAHREAIHIYVNKTFWNLDLQPRVIFFKTEIEHEGVTKIRDKLTRIELTATTRF